LKRSLARFLGVFAVVVLSGTALVLILPSAIAPASAVPSWIPPLLGAVFAASAFVAWKVRPDWKRD